MDSQDTEITLGTTKLLGLFFGLVIVCAVFFALGYTLGRRSDMGLTSASAAAPLQGTYTGPKPGGSASQPAPPMTFYKAVEQKDASTQLTPAVADAGSPSAAADQSASGPTSSSAITVQSSQSSNPPDPLAAIPAGGYFVQVAAVSKRDDAEALVDALKKKQYPAFVADGSSADKLFRVQLGPFADIKDAEGTRARLINDGYNPILKK
ncbi:MAG TPA: SPOR domain-containing protein [Candidatus Eremiobacteraceae bacterium]|nr:SPOR domain-containing protein [Candidatus Eremiobacteraceae bacterium]